jgi:hypothetical protein
VVLLVATEHSVGVPLHAVPDQAQPGWAVHEPEVRWASQTTDVPEQLPGVVGVQVHPRVRQVVSLPVLAQV